MKRNFVVPEAGGRVGSQPDTPHVGNNLQPQEMPPDTLLALWRAVCERSPVAVVVDPRVQLRLQFAGRRAGKYLMLHEDDLVQIGGHIEGLTQVGQVDSKGSWPKGELNDEGRLLKHGTPLFATKARP